MAEAVIHKAFVLASGDGASIYGDLRMPGHGTATAVVIVHGFKGFKDWGFFPHVAQRLAEEGHATVSFNFSRNGVTPDDPLAFSDLDSFAKNTFSRELRELRRVIDATRDGSITGTPQSRLGVLGHSRGGGIAILGAAGECSVDALTTWGAVATFDRWDEETVAEWRRDGRVHVLNSRTGQEMPLDLTLLEDYEQNRDRLDILAAAGRMSIPWLIVHGSADPTVSAADARQLHAASQSRLVLVEGAGHTFDVGHPFAGSSPALDEALSETLRHFRSAL